MPVDDFGNIADICISPESTLNRMNLGQLYEQFLNICITKIIKEIQASNDYLAGYWKVLEFFRDVNPSYADIVANVCCTDEKRINLVREGVEKEQLIVCVPSFLDTLSPEWCLKMADKYNIKSSPVSYNLRDSDGRLIRRVRTKKNIFIGKKYMYVLCKIPYPRACSVSYVNQYKIPIRIKEKRTKEGYPVGLTPIRLGEDEVRNLVMMIGEDTTAKILALYANVPESTNRLIEELMSADDPTYIPNVFSDASEIVAGNQTIKVYQHLMNTVGVDSVHTTATPEEMEELSKIEENFEW